MEFIIRNKWISLGGSSYVRDINENDVLKVKGKIFTFTRKKLVQELDGTLLYTVRNKFWYLFHRQAFVFDPEGNQVGYVKRKIFSLHDHYDCTCKYGDLKIIGNILGFDYHITLNGTEIGHISRKISLRDSFVLQVNDDVDWKFFIAFVIAIDNIVDAMRSDTNSTYYSSSN